MEANKTLSLIFLSLFSGPPMPLNFIGIALNHRAPNMCLAEYLGDRHKDFCKVSTLLIKY